MVTIRSMKLIIAPICLLVLSSYYPLFAQTPETQDSLKVFIEEVRVPLSAKDANGRFDPTVGLSDLMLKEDGVVQPLKSVYRVPASVLVVARHRRRTESREECSTHARGGEEFRQEFATAGSNRSAAGQQ